FGNIYLPKAITLTELPSERMVMTLGMYGDGDFFTLKGVIEELTEKLGFAESVDYEPVSVYPFLHPGRQAEIVKGDLKIGYIGQVHPEAVMNYDMKGDVYAAVLYMDIVTMLADFDIKYSGIAKFPGSSRDLALVCDKSVFVGNIEKIIKKNGGKILEHVSLFDVYEGDQVADGKKSVAFSLKFRALDRTLSDDEVNAAVDKILKELGKQGIELRS
ncbi:MAG: phenylalanine--tRNA ligase subunit beta, partial [Eubacterium sp.]|nr:phenylalanine--tRNA ligase subunit beta [Eubacterium sp.]